ncbi:hypothetical protein PFICI_14805 [Pestalotiopsis fici W106-1]|uniref:Uncharacterized protein n=1 Tax=Pestalotiopsis fici (strain W106-1 / CGMCC3.15140) TaxID=1229662 RepID=W3WJB6_PESFW|nr:uncharacterized protein PFICI_14805 [Pestalotiopsis fici W106-1]ETS73859.1 hypothetical protein PFICI_14805 [Pestalotiopsis fici W106-1]
MRFSRLVKSLGAWALLSRGGAIALDFQDETCQNELYLKLAPLATDPWAKQFCSDKYHKTDTSLVTTFITATSVSDAVTTTTSTTSTTTTATTTTTSTSTTTTTSTATSTTVTTTISTFTVTTIITGTSAGVDPDPETTSAAVDPETTSADVEPDPETTSTIVVPDETPSAIVDPLTTDLPRKRYARCHKAKPTSRIKPGGGTSGDKPDPYQPHFKPASDIPFKGDLGIPYSDSQNSGSGAAPHIGPNKPFHDNSPKYQHNKWTPDGNLEGNAAPYSYGTPTQHSPSDPTSNGYSSDPKAELYQSLLYAPAATASKFCSCYQATETSTSTTTSTVATTVITSGTVTDIVTSTISTTSTSVTTTTTTLTVPTTTETTSTTTASTTVTTTISLCAILEAESYKDPS